MRNLLNYNVMNNNFGSAMAVQQKRTGSPFAAVSTPPSAYYRFLDQTGDVIADSTGNGNTLTVSGTTLTTGPHANFSALDMSATDVARTASQVVTESTSYAISFWWRHESVNNNFTEQQIVGAFNVFNVAPFRYLASRAHVFNGARFIPGNTTVVTLQEWHHGFLHSWNSGQKLHAWMDGVFQFDGTGDTPSESNFRLTLGAADMPSRSFTGQIAEVAVWSGIGSADQEDLMTECRTRGLAGTRLF